MTDELNVQGGLKRFWRWHSTVAQARASSTGSRMPPTSTPPRASTPPSSGRTWASTTTRARSTCYVRYISECVFRWNGRKRTTLGRLAEVLRRGAARRLAYKVLIA